MIGIHKLAGENKYMLSISSPKPEDVFIYIFVTKAILFTMKFNPSKEILPRFII